MTGEWFEDESLWRDFYPVTFSEDRLRLGPDEGGRVIDTSSIGSLGNIGQANYSASKAGVIGLTRTLALEHARFGITVNCVAPGPVMTRMLAGVPEAIREKIVARVPAGRIAHPDEIAAVHAFLASDDAAFITGQVLFVDGGMSVGI